MTNAKIMNRSKTALIVAGGTGGHIFPALALATELENRGWNIAWLGTKLGMENKIVPENGIDFHGVDFKGLRGKGFAALFALPYRLAIALWQCMAVIRTVRPVVVVGFGGYVTVPACIAGKVLGKPVILHEQNAAAGMSNRWLSLLASKVYTAFPNVIKNGIWVGNPLRSDFQNKEEPEKRFLDRSGPIKILVIGGSLGAKFLNTFLPKVFSQLVSNMPLIVTHQSGGSQIEDLKAIYKSLNLEVSLTPFIQDTASAFADADLIICRAGASTVTEIAAVGAAAIYIPIPTAVDNHQYKNAMYLVSKQAGWLEEQNSLTEEKMNKLLLSLNRKILLDTACAAKRMQKLNAQSLMADACEGFAT